jgi:N-acetylglutamate synthase-like GNAT family acetyltransferase
VRRAVVDDLPNLLALWSAMNLPAADLERRLTEFQVAEDENGGLLGALGMEISNRHGRLHSEAFHDFALADPLREILWARMQSVAANHGLVRLWIAESAPFWKYNGFQPAAPDALKKMPAAWSAYESDWLTLPLRDEEALQTSLATDFTKLNEEERRRTEQLLRRARIAKNIGTALAILVAIAGILYCIFLIMHNPNMMRR